MSRRLQGTLAVLALVGMVLTALFFFGHQKYRKGVAEEARERVIHLTRQAATRIDGLLDSTMQTAESLAKGLADGTLSNDQMLAQMQSAVEKSPHIFGLVVAYAPFAHSEDRRLYAPYFLKKNGASTLVQVEDIYDYTAPEYAWFARPRSEGPLWLEPFFGKASGKLVTVYAVPFFKDGGTAGEESAGVVAVTASMGEIGGIAQNLDLGASGFAALASNEGVYLYHPEGQYVAEQKTVRALGEESGDETLLRMGEWASRREAGIVDRTSPVTGLSSWVVCEPVKATGWSLQSTFIKDDLPIDLSIIRRQRARILGVALVTAVTLLLLVLGANGWTIPRLWCFSVAVSVLLAFGICCLWSLALTYDSSAGEEGVVVADNTTLNNMVRKYSRPVDVSREVAPLFVPTGIYVESVRFVTSSDMFVTGYLWQKYGDGFPEGISRGVTIARSEDMKIEEVHRRKVDGAEVTRWSFAGIVNQSMEFEDYPLDQETLEIRMLHKDLNPEVVLVPDLGAYKITVSNARPGLNKDLAVPGWNVLRSGFSMLDKGFDTNFGVSTAAGMEQLPVLSYNIRVRRNFIDSFISTLTPLIVVSFLLFSMLMLSTKNEELLKFLFIGAGRTLSFCAALFFVVVFAHIDVRQKISTGEIFYLEYFYLVMYGALLSVSVNAILFAKAPNVRFVQFGENLISKLLFWPVMLGIFLSVTWYTFY